MNTLIRSALALLGAGGLVATSMGIAQANVIKLTPDVDLSTPYTVSLGDGAAGYTFSSRNTPFDRPIGVSTRGTAQAASLGAPFYDPPEVTSYFPNQAFGPDEGQRYVSYNDRIGRITSSTGDVYIGLKYLLGDGAHYGYARVAGYIDGAFMPRLLSFGYQTTPDTAIITGEAATADVPEPSTVALLLFGFMLIGGQISLRRRSVG